MRSNTILLLYYLEPLPKGPKYHLETVHRRATPLVQTGIGTPASRTLPDHFDWELHATKRSKLQLTVLFKIVHGLIDIPYTDYLIPTNSKTRSSHAIKFQQYSSSADSFTYSFSPRTIPLWNIIPTAAADTPSLTSFKRELSDRTFLWGLFSWPRTYTQVKSMELCRLARRPGHIVLTLIGENLP